jgi:hypothetical protein
VLLFVDPYDASTYRVSGFSQGRFKIERDPETGEPFIRAPRQDGVQLLGVPAGGNAGLPVGRNSELGVPLDEFVSYALGRTSTEGVPR